MLVVHEQHLQPMGCDVRLLGIIRGLLASGAEVSLFFRTHTPVAKRTPTTEDLATLLHIPRGYREEWLRRDVRQLRPPAIYEHAGTTQLARLFGQGWWNAVLVFFWFWHDPKPNVAELLLPPLHAFSPPGRRPFVAILSDDAHALRDARLASWEDHPGLRANYSARALQHEQREAAAYSLADMLLHITRADSSAERESFPFVRKYGLLRLSLAAGEAKDAAGARSTAAAGAAPSSSAVAAVERIGFLGNGQTPTNHLAIQWFLRSCWGALRARHPSLRLRLVGVRPGFRVGSDLRERACDAARDVHCGWAWGSPYLGAEPANGVDELGFLGDGDLGPELESWRLMIVPVLQTTGVNTKVYAALRLGIPLVITRAAAAPFELNGTAAALLADDAAGFTAAVETVLGSAATRARLSGASRAHWQQLVREDHSAEDLRDLLSTACRETTRDGFMSASKLVPLPLVHGDGGSGGSRASTSPDESRASKLPILRCFGNGTLGNGTDDADGGGRGRNAMPALPLLVGVHTASLGYNGSVARRIVTGAWRTFCTACSLRCAFPSPTTIHALEATPAEVPPGTELAVVTFHAHQVPDLDGVSLESPSLQPGDAAAARRPSTATPPDGRGALAAAQFLHFVVDLGHTLGLEGRAGPGTGGAARAGLLDASRGLFTELHGIVGTRMMLRATARPVLPMAPIGELCQDRALWRNAFRFIGVHSAVLPELWRRLAHDLPPLFRCDLSSNLTAATAVRGA